MIEQIDAAVPAIGIIGGSGLYDMEGFENTEEVFVETPFGAPSDAIIRGDFCGRKVCFLARHARGHRLLPTELNHRANIWAMRQLGVRWIIAVTAVGSLKEEYAPEMVVLPDQFYDRTSRRAEVTFFGKGIVAHVDFGDPVSIGLRRLLAEACRVKKVDHFNGGTYVNMDGPAFSTRAESETNRKLGFDVIGMTNLPEAKLAREAEIALATLAMVTYYDCWHVEEGNVNAHAVVEHVHANAKTAKKVIAQVIPEIPVEPCWPEHTSLDNAIMTDKSLWPDETSKNLEPILARFLNS